MLTVISGTDTDTLFPTPPSSGSNQNILECHQNDSITNSLSKHTVFLHHVISLQTGSKSSSGKGLDSLAKKSIEHSLDILQEHIGDTDISNRLQIQCIQSIENLYACCDCKLKNKILETVKLSADKLVTRIISREEYKSQASLCILKTWAVLQEAIFGYLLQTKSLTLQVLLCWCCLLVQADFEALHYTTTFE